MIANALLLTIAILLAYGFWLLDQLKFMAPYKSVLIHSYGPTLLAAFALLFANVFGAALLLQRKFFLKDTGRKLSHLDRQFQVGQVEMPAPEADQGARPMSRDPYPVDPHDERSEASGRSNSPFDSQPQVEAGSMEQAEIAASDLRAAARSTRNQRMPEALDSPRAHYTRDRTYFLRDSELETLAEVGTFRVIAAPDLARVGYGGDAERMEREIRRLKQQSLLAEKRCPLGQNKPTRLFALTKRGARLVRKSGRVPDEQAIYHGFAKPREAKHDADLYRLYQAEVDTDRIGRGSCDARCS